MKSTKRAFTKSIVTTLLLCAITAFAGLASADPVPMAPPVASAVNQNTVFNWQDVPANQTVPITSAVFDQNGYQLYDTTGETIVVPFTNNSLYVMEFAMSQTGAMYFVNDGNAPILYVPRHGYLLNATVPDGRWYPFSAAFQPSEPVYLGIAPSWSLFIGMGWYPGMHCHGGYWSNTSGGIFIASPGLFFNIGGTHYAGWNGYNSYQGSHTPAYHTGSFHRKVYQFGSKPSSSNRSFAGGGQGHTGSSSPGAVHSGSTAGHSFHGTTGSAGSSSGSFTGGSTHSSSGTHSSGSSSGSFTGGSTHTSGGTRSSGSSGRSSAGASHSTGGVKSGADHH